MTPPLRCRDCGAEVDDATEMADHAPSCNYHLTVCDRKAWDGRTYWQIVRDSEAASRFTATIERTDRIIEEAEEIRHESNLLIRDALPESEHAAAEARIDGYRLAIQNAANHLYLELREIEHCAQKRQVA